MIANVVTVPLSGSSTNSSSCWPVAGSASRGREVDLAVLAGPARRAACPPRARAGTRSREVRRCAGSRSCVGTTSMVTGSRSSALGSGTASAWSPSAKYAMSVIAPTGSSTQCACTRAPVLIASAEPRVDRVQQRGVGAVELDQRPRERPVQRLALQRLGLPGPRHHGADAGHRYDLGQRLVGDRVVLGGRHVHPAVRSADADDAALAQGGEELAEGRPDRTGVVEGQSQRRRKRRLMVIDLHRAALAGGHGIE